MGILLHITIFSFTLPLILTSQNVASTPQDGSVNFPETAHYNNRAHQLRNQHPAANDRLKDKTSPTVIPSQSYELPMQNLNLPNLQQINPQIQTAPSIGSSTQIKNMESYFPHNHQSVQNYPPYSVGHYIDPSLNQPLQVTPIRPVDLSSNEGQNSSPFGHNLGPVNHVPLRVQDKNEISTQVNTVPIPVQQPNPSSASVTGFGLDLMRVVETGGLQNTVVSPYSVALVLALLQQGSEGEAQRQISTSLHMDPLQSRETFRNLVSAVRNRRSRNILKIATSIFYSNNFDVHQQYKNDAVQFFSSDLAAVNFNNNVLTSKIINEWISRGTSGYIPNLVAPDTFPPETLMVLTNAVFFKGLWNSTFNPERTLERPFFLPGGAIKRASFMHNSGPFKAGRDQKLGADFLVMPFEGLQYSLITIVSSEKSDVGALIRQLSHGDLLRMLASPVRETIVSIPKFDIRVDTNLVEPLKALGIRNIFTANSGLSGLGDARGARPRVTGAVHAAILSIDERGGSAAAATLLAVSTLSIDFNDLEFRFHADRPFVSVLWDNELGVPLFIAKIVDPVVTARN